MSNASKIKVLFVCLGNICRSPMGEGLLRQKIRMQKLEGLLETDSCGTGGWHAGDSPDVRAMATMKHHGIDISDLRGRQFSEKDFDTFDWILCMDQSNFDGIMSLAKNPAHAGKVVKMLSFHTDKNMKDVPDPYFGIENGFENVYQMLDISCDSFLKMVLEHRGA